MKIGIYGSGAVGFAVGKGFSKQGHNVLFFDIDENKVKGLVSQGFDATSDSGKAVVDSDVIFVCVPTPTVRRKIDLSYIRAAGREIGRRLKSRKGYSLIVVKSTVIPGTCQGKVIPLIEKFSGKKAGVDFGLCSNPEFLRENQAFEDFINPDRIVIGELDARSGDLLETLYKGFSCPVIRTDLKTSELAKYANNAFYATKISFFNELHLICRKLGANSETARKIVQLDRFYPTHPWSHGKSFGGRCLPKDLDALIHFAASNKLCKPALLRAVRKVNEEIASFEPSAAELPASAVRKSEQHMAGGENLRFHSRNSLRARAPMRHEVANASESGAQETES